MSSLGGVDIHHTVLCVCVWLFVFVDFVLSIFTELQIRGGIQDNSKINSLISQRKHIL